MISTPLNDRAKNSGFGPVLRRLFLFTAEKLSAVGVVLTVLLLFGCNQSDSSAEKGKINSAKAPVANDEFFQEIGTEIGIDFVHSIGAEEMKNIVESVGGGAAFLDYDQDGFIDLYTCSGTWIEGFSKSKRPDNLSGNRLYHNRGDGTFEEVTSGAGVGGPW